MLNIFKHNLSLKIAWTLCISILVFHFLMPKYDYDFYTKEFSWDVLSYYLYLPLFFIYHDLGIHDYNIIQHLFDQYHFSTTFYQAFKAENGNWLMMYTMGFALLHLPFFLIGHVWAIAGGYPVDGFSFPYQFSVSSGVMLYIVAGVFVSRKVLLRLFSDKITALVLVLLLAGTNYFHEAIHTNMMPHAMLFTFYSLLLYYTIRWHEEPKMKYAGIVGLVIGFMTLARPSELLSILIPLLWNVYDKQSFLNKIKLLAQKRIHIAVLAGCCVMVGLPQLIYWKIIAGSWIVNSYQNVVGLDFAEPHIMERLFSFKKSWFIYTPMIIFPLTGLFFLKKYLVKARVAVISFVLINFYVLSCFAGWWEGGCFGLRYMVQSYAIMAIPFGAFFQFVSEKKIWVKLLAGVCCSFFLFLNLFQIWQYTHWIIPSDGMTEAYYKKIFLKTTVSAEDRKLLEYERSFDPNEKFTDYAHYNRRTIGYFDMDSVNTGEVNAEHTDTLHALSGTRSYRLSPQSIYSPTLRIDYAAITKNDHAWIRATVWYYPVHDLKENPATLVITFDHKGKPYSYGGYDLEKFPWKLNTWNSFTADFVTPYPYSRKDNLVIYLWLRGDKELYIDNLHVVAFDKK